MQLATILFGALFTVATATALGKLLLGKACRRLAGALHRRSAGALSFLVLLLAASHPAYPAVFAIVGVAAIARLPAMADRAWCKIASRRPFPVDWEHYCIVDTLSHTSASTS